MHVERKSRLFGALLLGAGLLVAGCSESARESTTDSPTASASVSPTVSTFASEQSSPSPTQTQVAASQGFQEGLSYWTTDSGQIAAFSRRDGSQLCLVVLYPEYRPDLGSVIDGPDSQQFNVEAKEGGVLFDPAPAQTVTVLGQPGSALQLTYPDGYSRELSPATEQDVLQVVQATYPDSDAQQLLSNTLGACSR